MPPGYIATTQTFFQKMRESISPESLQRWATLRIKQEKLGSDQHLIDLNELPRDVMDKKPSFSFVVMSESGDPNHISIVWGGGFGHYGIAVGGPEFIPAPGTYLYTIQWIKGVYVFADE